MEKKADPGIGVIALSDLAKALSIVRVHIEDAYEPGGKWDTFDDYYTVDFSRK